MWQVVTSLGLSSGRAFGRWVVLLFFFFFGFWRSEKDSERIKRGAFYENRACLGRPSYLVSRVILGVSVPCFGAGFGGRLLLESWWCDVSRPM
jgi:hypothetical protein